MGAPDRSGGPSGPSTESPGAEAMSTRGTTGTIRATADIAQRRGRTDLVERLEHAQRQRTDNTVRVVVVGDFKSGKSSLVNALVGSVACPVDDDLATAVITSVSHAPAPTASVTYKSEQGEDLAPAAVALDDLASLV